MNITQLKFKVEGNEYTIVGDQKNIHNLAFYIDEDSQGITNLVIPSAREGQSILPKAGWRAFSCGVGCEANGANSIAMGKNCKTITPGEGAIALGNAAYANGDGSIAIGHDVKAISTGAIALGGEGTQALGIASFAAGDNAQAKGNYSTAIGRSVYVNAEYGVAIGSSLVANEAYSTIIGKLNTKATPGDKENLLFAIGNGFWYSKTDPTTIIEAPNGYVGLIEKLNAKLAQLGSECLEKLGALDVTASDFMELRTELEEQYREKMNVVSDQINHYQSLLGAEITTQPGCALEVYANGSVAWNSKRAVNDMQYTTSQYVIAESSLEPLKWIYEYIQTIPHNTFDITIIFEDYDWYRMARAFGHKTNYYVQLYEFDDVSFYRYQNGEQKRLSVNNIGVEEEENNVSTN